MERAAPIGKGRPENVLELVRAYVRQRNRRVEEVPLPKMRSCKRRGSSPGFVRNTTVGRIPASFQSQ
jgi:hypothetical protein